MLLRSTSESATLLCMDYECQDIDSNNNGNAYNTTELLDIKNKVDP